MNIGEYSIHKKTVTLVLIVLSVVVGISSYNNLGRLEDPEFTIKDAQIVTTYPGATAQEVAEEVTNEIEKAAQQLGQLKEIKSTSQRGLSIVTPTIKDKYDKSSLPQVWDELRRKVGDNQTKLPPGTSTSVVNDDFGDVYGLYVAITGDGYTFHEIEDVANMLRKELLLVDDVKRISYWGAQSEVVYVEMERNKMARLGISQEQIYSALAAKNLVADAGHAHVGSEYITLDPTGAFTSEQQFRDLLISEPGALQQIFLGDVAEIRRGYQDPPRQILRSSIKRVYRDGKELKGPELDGIDLTDKSLEIKTTIGEPAWGLGISTVEGGNVVTMGEGLMKRFNELWELIPIGIESAPISIQSEIVVKAISAFIVNLIEAIIIVVVVLVIFMGFRSSIIIGFILFLTICTTFIFMDFRGIMLQRISLGALIIALGMLVDNAIVIVEGMQLKIEAGMDKLRATREVVGQNAIPLLGGTFVAITAFAAIGLSQDSTGEFCGSLFWVILISLLLSWVTAVTATPLLCAQLFKARPREEGAAEEDAYQGLLFRSYRSLLEFAIRRRWGTTTIVVALFAVSLYGFGFISSSFFPDSAAPQFLVDVWMPEGTHIRDTEAAIADLEEHIMSFENTKAVATHVGGGAMRFMLTYTPEEPNSAYAQLIVSVFDYRGIGDMLAELQPWMNENLPEAMTYCQRYRLGPGGTPIEARFSGPDPVVLRKLADQATEIMHEDGGAQAIRHDWRQRVKVIRPVLAESQARRNGIARPDVARVLKQAFDGYQAGVYREGIRLIPIVSRPPEKERIDIDNIRDLQIYSPAACRMIPLRQIVTGFETVYEDQLMRRRNRKPTITAMCDKITGEASVLFERIRPKVEAIELPPGYEFEWGGEYESSGDAQAALAKNIPTFFGLMVLIVIMLFNNLRQPLIIWLTVPLAIIGVTAGLLMFNQPFGFMSVLGVLSLSGMLIKNAIVLIDQINLNVKEGMTPYDAVVNSGVSRMRPVMMAAATTILGMAPLLLDVFFVAMAVTIMFGLLFATVLTLIFVPTLYTILYRIRSE